jgi:hypothetical protein
MPNPFWVVYEKGKPPTGDGRYRIFLADAATSEFAINLFRSKQPELYKKLNVPTTHLIEVTNDY